VLAFLRDMRELDKAENMPKSLIKKARPVFVSDLRESLQGKRFLVPSSRSLGPFRRELISSHCRRIYLDR